MSKLSCKLLIPTIIIIAGIMFFSAFTNLFVIQKYLLRQQKNRLNEVYQLAVSAVTVNKEDYLRSLEQTYGVTILTFPFTADENDFNDSLREGLQNRKIGFQRLWLWTTGLERLQQDHSYTQIYDQGHLQYSILVRFGLNTDSEVYVISMNIPYSSHVLQAVNDSTAIIFGIGGLLIIFLLLIRTTKILKPIKDLTQMAHDLAGQNFKTIEIHTNDEIESLAASFNHMSNQLQKAQSSLSDRNHQMEHLLSNVAHEVKTPVAVIKAYTIGMRDGIDDGTFLDEILKQSDYIDAMIQNLLTMSRIELADKKLTTFSISGLLTDILSPYFMILEQENRSITCDIDAGILLTADQKTVEILFNNLISNAIKYAGSMIHLTLTTDVFPVFWITNDLPPDSDPDLDQIWDPFFVGESSRSKQLSGTGLGLSIAKRIADIYHYQISCSKSENKITFQILFVMNEI